MASFALFLVWILAGILFASAGRWDKPLESDSSTTHKREIIEITNYDGAIDDVYERIRREAPKTETSNSQFIRSEKTTTADNIIWRQDSETRKSGRVPTVTRVLYHGIYPSLNITEPVNATSIGKYRQKRAASSQNTLTDGSVTRLQSSSSSVPESASTFRANESSSRSVQKSVGTLSDNELSSSSVQSTAGTLSANELEDSKRTAERGEIETKSSNGRTAGKTQQYSPSYRVTPYPTPVYSKTKKPTSGNHYERASYSPDASVYTPYLDIDPYAPKDHAQGSIRYRTAYYPSGSEYQGDPENKGHVRLISVGYYNVNESTADLRSYRNPKVDRRVGSNRQPNRDVTSSSQRIKRDDLRSSRRVKREDLGSSRRVKRDDHWCWLDKFLKSVWIIRNPEKKVQENEIPGSEPMKLEESEYNEEAQDAYGYSSSGNGHHSVDRIYLVQTDPIPSPTSPKPEPEKPTATSSLTASEELSMAEGMPLPDQPVTARPVLIQAPNVMPYRLCRPPKRMARGRCRTVW